MPQYISDSLNPISFGAAFGGDTTPVITMEKITETKDKATKAIESVKDKASSTIKKINKNITNKIQSQLLYLLIIYTIILLLIFVPLYFIFR